MSDILIKNMEMPKGKEIVLRIDEKGEVYVYGSYPTELHKAIPVPPHGRCIDVDALIKSLSLDEDDAENGASLLMAIFIEVLKAAPTIIEAELPVHHGTFAATSEQEALKRIAPAEEGET